ncbi:hypothetical protein BO71DRAFT_105040 [Aspergillus ellipticus CBS 707.79]|uniref:Cytochrome P450 n=1 Tax=Aspergillus ellipticus CBS 707.79 TaxID=1448320 RepID=A0A319CWE1_9EURO|nr:hypothetical protein BO71DRAFT_105040 [Aspergillus ellipticus CBS 707.79]
MLRSYVATQGMLGCYGARFDRTAPERTGRNPTRSCTSGDSRCLRARKWPATRGSATGIGPSTGADAEVFNPDRWLGDPEQVKLYEKYSLAWGYRSRTCLGKHFAMIILYKAPVALFIEFETIQCSKTPQTPKPHSSFHGPGLF